MGLRHLRRMRQTFPLIATHVRARVRAVIGRKRRIRRKCRKTVAHRTALVGIGPCPECGTAHLQLWQPNMAASRYTRADRLA